MKKITTLVGNGDIPSFYKEVLDRTYIVGVDGGGNFLHKKDILPDEVIGDFDSLDKSVRNKFKSKGVKITELEEQDTTDIEKDLYSVNSQVYICIGFWSNEVDHSLGSLHILQKYYGRRIIFITEESIYFSLPQKGKLNIPKKTTISIYPLTQTDFKLSKGLKYPLNNITLKQGEFIGIRNETSKDSFEWEISKGESIAIVPAKYRFEIIKGILDS